MTLVEELENKLIKNYQQTSNDCPERRFFNGYKLAFEEAISIVQHHSDWIPASQPPESGIEVLVQSSWKSLYVGWYQSEEKCWYTGSFGFDKEEVVAWQPLPEPYEED